MKTIKLRTKAQKNIDLSFLQEKYKNKIDISNINFDTNIDNLKDVELGARVLLESISKDEHIVIVTDYDCD